MQAWSGSDLGEGEVVRGEEAYGPAGDQGADDGLDGDATVAGVGAAEDFIDQEEAGRSRLDCSRMARSRSASAKKRDLPSRRESVMELEAQTVSSERRSSAARTGAPA